MKIKKIIIKNFLSIEDLELDFNDDYLILFGENDSGKSTIFSALAFFYNDDENFFIHKTWKYFFSNFNSKTFVEVHFYLNKNDIKNFNIKNKKWIIEDRNGEQYLKLRRVWNIKNSLDYNDVKNCEYIVLAKNDEVIEKTSDLKLGIFFYAPTNLFKKNLEILSQIQKNCPIIDDEKLLHNDLIDYFFEKIIIAKTGKKINDINFIEAKKNIKEEKIISNAVLEILEFINNKTKNIWEMEFGCSITTKTVFQAHTNNLVLKTNLMCGFNNFKEKYQNPTFAYKNFCIEQAGEGFQRFFLLWLAYFSKKIEFETGKKITNNTIYLDLNLLLIEEPEAFLHPQILEKFNFLLENISLSKNSFSQILVSSHSPYFLNLHVNNNLNRLVYIKKIKNSTKSFQNKENISQKTPLDSERSNAFFAKNIIICEGVTDKKALTFLLKNEKNCLQTEDFKNINFYILESGGKNEIHKYLSILHKLKLNWFLIYDRDNNDLNNEKFEKDIQKFLDEESSDFKKNSKIFSFPIDLENFFKKTENTMEQTNKKIKKEKLIKIINKIKCDVKYKEILERLVKEKYKIKTKGIIELLESGDYNEESMKKIQKKFKSWFL